MGFSKENTNAIKGISAVFVVIFHLSEKLAFLNDIPVLNFIVYLFGFTTVAMFFFISGFGLKKQLVIKGNEYLNDFPKKRILGFYMDYLLFFSLTIIVKLFTKDPGLSFIVIIKSLTIGKTIVTYGWYWTAILFLYICFYLINKFTKKFFSIILSFFSVGLWLFLLYLIDDFSVWYLTVFMFPLGIIYANFQEKIDCIFINKKNSIIILFAIMLIYSALIITSTYYHFLPGFIEILVFSLLTVVFYVFITHVVSLSNFLTRFLGNISAQLYFMHGFVVLCFGWHVLSISNNYLYAVIVFIISIVLSFIFKIFQNKYDSVMKKIFKIK